MEPDVDVMQLLLVRQAMTDPSWMTPGWKPFVLHGVSYTHRVPPDTEFPKVAGPPWAIFFRATARSAGSLRALVRVHFRNVRGKWEWLSNTPLGKSIDFPDTESVTRDVTYNLPFFRMGGIGLHAVSIHFRSADDDEPELPEEDENPPSWAISPDEIYGCEGWTYGGVTYIWVERPT